MVDLRKYGIILIGLLCLTATAVAQQFRFVYLQTDNRQPFYVKLNNTVYSSSAAGYLIIPRLTDNTYTFQIGFPKNEWPQQMVDLEIKGKDAGYLLRQFDQKGWGLFNLQTMAVTMARAADGNEPTAPPPKDDGDFANILAGVVNAPEIAKQPQEETKTPSPQPEKVVAAPATEKPVTPVTNTLTSGQQQGVFLLADEALPGIRKQVYVVRSGEATDTVDVEWVVAIEAPKETEKTFPTIPASRADEQTSKAKEPQEPVTENKDQAATPPKVEENQAPPSDIKKAPVKLPCNKDAGEKDFLKLRKRMASRTNDYDMISDAVKAFKSRCYNTTQVRHLAALFLNNQGRYSFLDAVYPYVLNREEYGALADLLTDEHFRNRFDAMLQN